MWWWPLIAVADPSAVDSIRARWKQVQGLRQGEELYALELNANPEDRQWAAVGTYNQVTTCYRVIGESPYPDPEPILVTVRQMVSSHAGDRTFLYTDAGALVFAHATSDENPSWRVYWSDKKVVRIQHGDAVVTGEGASKAAAGLRLHGEAMYETCRAMARSSGLWEDVPGTP